MKCTHSRLSLSEKGTFCSFCKKDMNKINRESKEEIRELQKDLVYAQKRGDWAAVLKIQDRLEGLK